MAANNPVGTLVPNVYIQSIVLENPHEFKDDGSIQSAGTGGLNVNFSCILKDTSAPGLISKWLGNQDIQKVYKVAFYALTKEGFSPYMLKWIRGTIKEVPNLTADAYAEYYGNVSNADLGATALYSDPDHQIPQSSGPSTTVPNALGRKVTAHLSKITQYAVGNDGAYDIAFHKKLDLEKEPEFLAIYAVPYLDLTEIEGLRSVPAHKKKIVGNIVEEIVLRNGQVNTAGYVFKRADGSLWKGARHYHPAGNPGSLNYVGYMTGKKHTKASEHLTLQKVSNLTVQDFRLASKINQMKFDFSNEIEQMYSSVAKSKSFYHDIEKKHPFFSNVFISRSPGGKVKSFFALDYKKLVKENCQFPVLFDMIDSSNLLKLMNYSKITSFRAFRRRMKPTLSNNSLGSPSSSNTVFDKEEPVTDIIINAVNKGGDVKGVTIVGAVTEIQPHLTLPTNSFIRFFTIADNQIAEVTAGFYQYGIEIDFVDGTMQFLKEKLKDLLKVANTFKLYYQDSMKNSSIDKKPYWNIASNKFTQEFQSLKNNSWKGVFEVYLDVLNCVMKPADLITIKSADSGNTPGGDGVRDKTRTSIYTALVEYLVNISSPKTGSPYGISVALKMIEDMISQLAKFVKVEMVLGRTADTPARATTVTSKSPTLTHKVVVYFNEMVDSDTPKGAGFDYFSKKNSKPMTEGGIGLDLISENSFKTVIAADLAKFVNASDTGTTSLELFSNTMALSTLSPSMVQLPSTEPISFGSSESEMNDVSKYAETVATALMLNQFKKSPQIPLFGPLNKTSFKSRLTKSEQRTRFNLSQIMAEKNVTAESPLTENIQDIAEQMLKKSGRGKRSNKRSPISGRAYKNEDIDSKKVEALKQKYAKEMDKVDASGLYKKLLEPALLGKETNSLSEVFGMSKMLNSAEIANSFNPNNHAPSDTQINIDEINLNTTPIQLKSEFIGATVGAIAPLSNYKSNENFAAILSLRQNSLVNVEYLESYDQSTPVVQLPAQPPPPIIPDLSKPIFKLLTPEALQIIKNRGGGNVICRLIPYTNSKLNVKKTGMNLQIYNKYFILDVEQTKQVPYLLSADSGVKKNVGAMIKTLNMQSSIIPTEYIYTNVKLFKQAKKKKKLSKGYKKKKLSKGYKKK